MTPLPLPIGSFLLQQRWSVADAQLADFEHWYDEEHLPEVTAVPGILVGRRFRRDPAYGQPGDDFAHVTQYEIASLDAFQTPEYKALLTPKHPVPPILANSRTLYRALYPEQGTIDGHTISSDMHPPSGVGLFHIMMSSLPECEDDFNTWYNEEHVPMISGRDGILHGRRLVALEGAPSGPDEHSPAFRYLANYELAGPTVPDAGPDEGEYPTPWRIRLGDRLAARVQHLELVTRVEGTRPRPTRGL